ncbi:DMT family transporter [Micromonospora eburnea]|nr:DMT family transporter [Micromonospora eburnea]
MMPGRNAPAQSRNAPARSADVNDDGVTDARDGGPRTGTAVVRGEKHTVDLDRDDRPTTTDLPGDNRPDRPAASDHPGDRRPDRTTATDLPGDNRPDRAAASDLPGDRRPDRPVEEPDGESRSAPVALGPKPRASLLATFGLIVSVVGALFVLSGTLAGYGIGLGAVGAVLAVLGLVATRRRHVAGTTDALVGVVIGLAAVVLGIVALTGRFDWPTTDGEWVGRFREWLDSQLAAMF